MKVKIMHPGLPDGYKVTLTGLNAVLLNNEDVEVDDEAIAQYELTSGKKFADVLQGAAFTGVRPDPPQQDTEQTEEQLEINDKGTQTFTTQDGVEE